jgi:peptidoglycan/LPS O-acetylase OafA/YrhL
LQDPRPLLLDHSRGATVTDSGLASIGSTTRSMMEYSSSWSLPSVIIEMTFDNQSRWTLAIEEDASGPSTAPLLWKDDEMAADVSSSQEGASARSRNFGIFWMLVRALVAVVFAFQRDTLGEVVFALWAVVSGALLVARPPFRIRIITRLFGNAAFYFALSVILVVIAINFSTQSRWTEAAIFYCLATVPVAVAASLLGFARRANKALRDRERSSKFLEPDQLP